MAPFEENLRIFTELTDRPAGWQLNPSQPRSRLRALVPLAIGASLPLGPLAYATASASDSGLRECLLAGALLCLAGGARRWKQAPWLVALYGLVAGLGGLGFALASIIQMAIAGVFPLMQLMRGVLALIAVGPCALETLASLQLLRTRAARGKSPGEADA